MVDYSNSIRDLSPKQRELLLLRLNKASKKKEKGSLPTIKPNQGRRHEPFALTDIQQAYWIGRNGTYELSNVSTHGYLEIDSLELNLERFNQAWQQLIDQHDMLRAVFLSDGRQQILPQVPPYRIQVKDLRHADPETRQKHLEAVREEMSHQVLPSDQWPLFEIRGSLVEEKRVRLHISLDLLIADAWSLSRLFESLFELYHHPDSQLVPLEISFRDYVLASEQLQESALYQRSVDYWRNRLWELPPAPELPLARNPSSVRHPRFVRRDARLEPETWSQLKARASRSGLTPSGVLLAAFTEVLGTWSKSPRFSLNLTLFNRLPLHPQVNDLVGDFTSLTLLAVDNSVPSSFEARALRLQKQLWQDLEHRYYSGVRVLRDLARQHSGTTGALMPVVFTSTVGLSRTEQDNASASLLGEVVYNITQTPQVWLDHQVFVDGGGALGFNWDAVEELFPPGLLDDMFDAYCHLLHRLATDEDTWQQTVQQLLPPAQIEQLAALNATEMPVPEGMLHTLFLAQALVRPQQVAVEACDQTLSYEELSRRSNQVGRRLRQLGAEPNTLVAVVMEKGWEQVVAVLGVLHSGAAYLPLDPKVPPQRLWFLLEHAQVKLVLTQARWAKTLDWPEKIQRLGVDSHDLVGVDDQPLEPVQGPEDLAYVIYTSGSTGQPKGVMVNHRSVVNTIVDINSRFEVGPLDRVLALSSLSFDLSVYDIFGTLAAGATIVLPDAAASRDPADWVQLIAQTGVSVWNSVPALMQMLVEYASGQADLRLRSLRLVLLSGDWIPIKLPIQIKFLVAGVQVISLGGATEASIWSIIYPIETLDSAIKSIPYGKPMRNQHLYVLNQALQPCPVWVPGELYIGGTGLAQGYWQDPEKTRMNFLTHPRTGERLYRTGDLGRYLPDGNIEFLGREDFQVKIQGHRIELGEIEQALLQHPAVLKGVVVATGKSPDSKRLVAYLVCDQKPESHAWVPGDAPFQQMDGVLLDPIERLDFKLKQPGLRQDLFERPLTELVKPKLEQSLQQTHFTKRRSHRQFLQQPIACEQFSQFLSCLLQLPVNGATLPKYRYGSAGGLYPVQLYLYIKPERVEGLTAGTYYYHPQQHRLVLLTAGAEISRDAHAPSNFTTFEQSAFSLFLVGQLNAITPMYGNKARDFCLIEAGLISQLLETSAPDYNLGLCQIGGFDFERVRPLFALDQGHEYLYCLLGGHAEETENGMFPENQSPILSAQAWRDRQLQENGVAAELKSYLQQKLPEYMVPAAFVLMDTLPLTPNGKVDRNALPEPGIIDMPLQVLYMAPESEVEYALAAVWQQVLQLDQVGIHNNFFDLGGNSIHVVQIHSRLQEILHKKIAVADLFEYPTIRSLATRLSKELINSPLHDG